MKSATSVICAALLGVMVATTPAEAAITVGDFLKTEAAQAYRAKDYARALSAFEALLAEHPDDPLILRYIGMSLDRLGRSEEALEPLKRSLELSPNNAAASFYLGLSLYKLGRYTEARPYFEAVLATAAGSKYAAYARDMVTAIVTQSEPVVSPAPSRRFDLFAQASYQYDSSTGIASGTEANRAVEFVSAGYNVLQSGPWLVRVEAQGYANQHFEDKFRSRDIGQAGGGVEASYTTELGSVAVVKTLGFNAQQSFQDYETFSYSYGLASNLDIGWTEWAKSAVAYDYKHGEFEDRTAPPLPAFPQFFSRDNDSHTVAATQYFIARIDDVTAVANGGYTYSKTMADGSTFDAHGETARGGLTFYFPDDVVVDLSGSGAWNTRPRLRIGNQNAKLETESLGAAVSVAVPINDRLRATASYNYVDQSADFPNNPGLNPQAAFYEYTRHIATVAVAFTLN